MNAESVTELEAFDAPYGKAVRMQEVVHDSGLRLLRVTIREGNRFTIMDLDAATAAHWAAAMARWAEPPAAG